MPKRIEDPAPGHPAIVSGNIVMVERSGRTYSHIEVECPVCKKTRLMECIRVRKSFNEGKFDGKCRKCWSSQKKPITFRNSRNKEGKSVDGKGYILLLKNAIQDDDLKMFYEMKGNTGYVLEHRWEMAKSLGRPLNSWELVDHIDGNKQNNKIENLRIYIRGSKMPGDHNGWGDYYKEWQESLRVLENLERIVNSMLSGA